MFGSTTTPASTNTGFGGTLLTLISLNYVSFILFQVLGRPAIPVNPPAPVCLEALIQTPTPLEVDYSAKPSPNKRPNNQQPVGVCLEARMLPLQLAVVCLVRSLLRLQLLVQAFSAKRNQLNNLPRREVDYLATPLQRLAAVSLAVPQTTPLVN